MLPRLKMLFLALFLTVSASADPASWSRSQREVARELQARGKTAEAVETLRLALAAARKAGLETETARCLYELGWLSANRESDSAYRNSIDIWREAEKNAAKSGDAALELEILNARLSREDSSDPEVSRERIDAAVVAGHPATLTELAFFEQDIQPALDALDALAEASLARGRKDQDAELKALAAARAIATKQGWKRVSAHVALLQARAATAEGALRDAEAALAGYRELGNLRGQGEARLEKARALGARDAKGAFRELEESLKAALEIEDADLEARVLQAMAASADAARRPELQIRAARAELRRHEAVMEKAAFAASGGADALRAAELLREEGRRRPDTAAEIDRALASLGFPSPSARVELAPERRARLKALLAGDGAGRYLIALEILRRHEAFPVIAEVAAKSGSAWLYANALETLALHEDLATLLDLSRAKDGFVADAAAAAVFRLANEADLPSVKKALDGASPSASRYLKGVLARFGDASALKDLQASASGADVVLAHHAAVVLGRLGFAGAGLRLDGEGMNQNLRSRILARAPESWGLVFADSPDPDDAIQAARANHVRRVRSRVEAIEEANNIWQIMYLLPTTPEEARICGTGWILRAGKLIAEDESGDVLTWVGGGLGYDLYGGVERLRKHKERNEAAFALEDLESHTVGHLAGTQTRVLTVSNGDAWARVRVTASPEMGQIVDTTLQLPFLVEFDQKNGHNGSLAGAIGQISLQISLSGLVPEATLRIPGFEPIRAMVKAGADNRLWIYAILPVEKEGEGLGAGKLIPNETLEKGTVTLDLAVEQSRASMTFPIALLVPPAKDKPDLVAVDLTVQPSTPKPGEEALLRLRTRNTGKAIDKDGLLNVRFSVLNPQNNEGRRTIDVRLTEAKGWRPGEWRYFEARPTCVRGWYMNSWSHTWTLELGDTRLVGTVDAEGLVAEESEDNNSVELQVPLYLGEEEGKRLAGDELLGRLAELLKQIGDATTEAQARGPANEAVGLLGRARVSSPEIDLARRHLQAASQAQIHRIRVRAALARARELARDPKVNQEALRGIMAELADAETGLMDSGVPVKEDTISWWRNRVQVAANVVGASNDASQFAGIVRGTESSEALNKVGENLARLDGALQWVRYVRDRADQGEYDNSDPIEGTCKIFGAGNPGLSNLHQAMFKAEIDYVDRGFRKEAGALDALADLISGKPGAQERLDAAVRDVDAHVSAGPFSEEARKDILKGAVKDIPVIGKLLDAIWSWK